MISKNSKKLHRKKIQFSNNKKFRIEWNNGKNKFFTNSKEEKEKVKKEIYEKDLIKYRKKREKQRIYNYESLSIIGRDVFGEVHIYLERKTGKIVAIKKKRSNRIKK